METPKAATTASSVRPERPRSGRGGSAIAPAASAPTAGALRSKPSPSGPVWRIVRA